MCIGGFLGSNNDLPPAKKCFEGKIRNFSINYGSNSYHPHRTHGALITAWINVIGIEKVHRVLTLVFYSQKFPVIRQNTAWKKSSLSTVLRNTSGDPKLFPVVVEAPKSHHASCTYSIWRKWVHFGSTHSKLIFGRCEKFTSVIAIFVKTFLCTLRHPKTTWYHSKA